MLFRSADTPSNDLDVDAPSILRVSEPNAYGIYDHRRDYEGLLPVAMALEDTKPSHQDLQSEEPLQVSQYSQPDATADYEETVAVVTSSLSNEESCIATTCEVIKTEEDVVAPSSPQLDAYSAPRGKTDASLNFDELEAMETDAYQMGLEAELVANDDGRLALDWPTILLAHSPARRKSRVSNSSGAGRPRRVLSLVVVSAGSPNSRVSL